MVSQFESGRPLDNVRFRIIAAISASSTNPISPALLVAINGFLALVSLFALFGVWFDRLPAP